MSQLSTNFLPVLTQWTGEEKKNPLPDPPTWRDFSDQKVMDERRGKTFQIPKDDKIIKLI